MLRLIAAIWAGYRLGYDKGQADADASDLVEESDDVLILEPTASGMAGPYARRRRRRRRRRRGMRLLARMRRGGRPARKRRRLRAVYGGRPARRRRGMMRRGRTVRQARRDSSFEREARYELLHDPAIWTTFASALRVTQQRHQAEIQVFAAGAAGPVATIVCENTGPGRAITRFEGVVASRDGIIEVGRAIQAQVQANRPVYVRVYADRMRAAVAARRARRATAPMVRL